MKCEVENCPREATHEMGPWSGKAGKTSKVCFPCLQSFDADDGKHGWPIGTRDPKAAAPVGAGR